MIDTHAETGANDTRTEATLRQLMDEQAAAMRSRDADYLVSRYAADAVTFDLAPPLQNVGKSVRDADSQRAWFAGFDGAIDYEISDLSVLGGDDFAVCRSLNRLAATPKGRTDRFQLWFRATVCWRRSADGWHIVHEHNSTPFYMDGSLRAAVDLTP
jgi:ketosteroid isomerase-like protein